MTIDTQSRIGIIGAGAMGSGIAQIAATAGHDVILYDINKEALVVSSQKLKKILDRQVEKGRMTDEEVVAILGRIHHTRDTFSLKECSLVIEAIVEDLPTKKRVFTELEEHTQPSTILATNTSSLPVTAIASACKDPSRVVGIHFFNPAPLMKLVEIVPAIQTSEEVTSAARKLIDSWGKDTVVAKDTPGFIVNRIARPFYSEALRLFDEGFATKSTIDWAMTEIGKFRMGPFTLMDFIGHDVNFAVTSSMYYAYFNEARYRPSFSQQRLVDAGYLGRKSGRGFYNYNEQNQQELPEYDEELGHEIFKRILYMLINEAADALYWGVASAKEIDIAMTKGVNYPKGLLNWADEIGITVITEYLDALYDDYHESRYRVSPMLRKMSKTNSTFFN